VVDRTDVAVIGAGVIGLSCARELAGAGVNVTLLEAAEAAGRGSSALANGGIRAQFTTEVNIAFSRFSIGELEKLERTVGGLGFHQTGYLLLAGAYASERRLRDAVELQRRVGVETRWLEPDEIASMVPFVRAEGIRGGTFPRPRRFPRSGGPPRGAPRRGAHEGRHDRHARRRERDRTRLRRPAREG
jgi:sarcosine oxidase subunit beta